MCMLGTAISQLFYFKSNAPRYAINGYLCMFSYYYFIGSFSSYFVILVTHPAGKWLAKVLPDRKIHVYRWSFSLNPGAWSRKEHLLGMESRPWSRHIYWNLNYSSAVVVFAVRATFRSCYCSHHWSANIPVLWRCRVCLRYKWVLTQLCGIIAYLLIHAVSIQRLFYKQDIGMIAGMALLLTTQLSKRSCPCLETCPPSILTIWISTLQLVSGSAASYKTFLCGLWQWYFHKVWSTLRCSTLCMIKPGAHRASKCEYLLSSSLLCSYTRFVWFRLSEWSYSTNISGLWLVNPRNWDLAPKGIPNCAVSNP